MEECAVILGIGIDKPESEEGASDNETSKEPEVTHVHGDNPVPKTVLIRLTAQIGVPGRIPLGPGTGSQTSSSGQKPVWVLSSLGRSVAMSSPKALNRSSPFWK